MVYLKLTVCWLAPQGAFYHMKLYSSIQSALFLLCIWFYKSVKWKTCSWLVSGQRAWSQLTGLLVAYISCKVIPGHWFIKGQQVKKEITCCLTLSLSLSLSLYICISLLWLIQSVYWWHMMKFINLFALFYCVAPKQFHIWTVHNKYTLNNHLPWLATRLTLSPILSLFLQKKIISISVPIMYTQGSHGFFPTMQLNHQNFKTKNNISQWVLVAWFVKIYICTIRL